MTNCSEKVRWKLSFLCVKLLQSDHLICSWESYLTCKCVFLSTFLQCLSCNQKFVKKQIPWGLYFLTKVYHRRDQNKTFRAIQGRSSNRYLIKRALRPFVESDEPGKSPVDSKFYLNPFSIKLFANNNNLIYNKDKKN